MAVILITGCATPHQNTGPWQQQGRAAGAATGGVLGGVIGNNVGDGNNQVLGAAIGATLGAFIGDQYGQRQDYIDNQIRTNREMITHRTVSIQNSNGSYTDITLVQQGNSWIGPRGERYTSFPSESQLRAVYGF